jgi:hypothetical protein
MMTNNPEAIRIELERKILHGLSCEWETALWVLSGNYRKRMIKPLFSLRDLKSTWGSWSGSRGEIRLSRRLVMDHPWHAVREVLLHEMAHQLAEQALGVAVDESPHGDTFMKACHLLRANPRASGAYRLLKDPMDQHAEDPNDRILIRIKKLLALAQSRNQYEAEAAMLKAHELIAKYNIDRMALEEKRNYLSVFLTEPTLRQTREIYHLANLIQAFYFVQGIWVPAYVMEKGKMGRALEISGTRQNIAMAGYVYDFVKRFIEMEWVGYNRKKKLNRYRKTDFSVGIIEGFRHKLTGKNETHHPTHGRNLVPVEDRQLKEYITYRYPRTSSFSRAASGQDPEVIEDGMAIGKKLILHKGISEKKSGEKPLIGFSGSSG